MNLLRIKPCPLALNLGLRMDSVMISITRNSAFMTGKTVVIQSQALIFAQIANAKTSPAPFIQDPPLKPIPLLKP